MFPRRLFVPFIVAILVSCTAARPVPQAVPSLSSASGSRGSIPAGALVTVARDSAVWLVRTHGTSVERWSGEGSREATVEVKLPLVPWELRATSTGGVLAVGNGSAAMVDAAGAVADRGPALDVAGDERLERRARSAPGRSWGEWNRASVAFVTPGGEIEVPVADDVIFIVGRLLSPGGRAVIYLQQPAGDSLYAVTAAERTVQRIAGPFPRIDSFDVAPDGTEVVFSAQRDTGFDIGLVAVEGSEVRWIGPDPLDERKVRWAPRGNKFAFVLETPGGAVIRSVHVPTGFQVSAPLSLTRVRDLAWDPQAERLALLVTSADAAERVEMMRYDGSERRTMVPAAIRGEGADQLAGVPGAVLFNPESIRYNENLPLVIWEAADGAFVFHEGRARLQQNRRIGSVVLSRGATAQPAFWDAIAELGWVDPDRVFIVADAFGGAADIPAGIRATVLTRESRAGSSESVTIVRSDAGSLEDFAVLWLGERLRGFEREHDGN